MSLDRDFIAELQKHFAGEILTDPASRVLYSTDASMYQIEPLGAALPRTQDDLQAAVELAAKYKIPILPRGAGTSLAGQAIGRALVLDCSRWLDKIIEINLEARTATVEPGVVLAHLNRVAAQAGLQFGPDPASAERATMGGVIANNATGAHSILYGMTADHVLQSDVILSDGSLAVLGEIDTGNLTGTAPAASSLISKIVSSVFEVRHRYESAIRSRWPAAWRNSAGYRLNYLLPWSPTAPSRWQGEQYPPTKDGTVNLASLLAGSEGTLAVIRRATVNLVPKPKHTILSVLAYRSIAEACDVVPALLEHNPSAIELVPEMLVRLARTVPAYAAQMGWVIGNPAALLIVEFSGDEPGPLRSQARGIGEVLTVAESKEEQARVWNVRRVGLGLLDSRPQSARPVAFMEDCAIPVERLGEFVREVEKILSANGTQAGFYAHASAGCLHIRPILDLKTFRGVAEMRSTAEAVLALTLRLGGAMSSEHGDGLARSEWLRQTYSPDLIAAMRKLKSAADPDNLLNPGKLLDAPKMDADLRYGANYQVDPWIPAMSFEGQGGLAVAIEQCNGQGVCRKMDGVMCPSYQATRDEMHSTRGRANLLRALIGQSRLHERPIAIKDRPLVESTAAALDLCLACKGCKAECPSGVDMAKLKHAFEAEYYKSHRRPWRDYFFGYFHILAAALAVVPGPANAVMQNPMLRRLGASVLGIAQQRPFPIFSNHRSKPAALRNRKSVIFFSDTLTHYSEPHIEQAAFDVLDALGFDVHMMPVIGAGAALLSKGFLKAAGRHAGRVLDQLNRIDPTQTIPIVGLEPAEIYTLKHDYFDLVPARSSEVANRTSNVWLLDEFLIRAGAIEPLRVATNSVVKFHPHCHQQAEPPSVDGLATGTRATVELLRLCGYEVDLTKAGCCGMAGSFGYEAGHYDLSQRIGELKLFPLVRKRGEAMIASTGASCRMQITHATGAPAEHPISLVARALKHS